MAIRAVLFDLDGTLLPMDQDRFAEGYFRLLLNLGTRLGFSGRDMVNTVLQGTAAMQNNDGRETNSCVFWRNFAATYGPDSITVSADFDSFYRHEFLETKQYCGFNPDAADAVRACKAMGLRVAVASNPIFPAMAMEHRIRWAGLQPEQFEFVTSYEQCRYCKPKAGYFLAMAERLQLEPEQCLMVGNDTEEDMAAEKAGMKTFLLTDCLVNRPQLDIDAWPHGDFTALRSYLEQALA